MIRLPRRPSRLFWKLFLGHAVLTASALGISVLLVLREFDRFYIEELTEHLRAQAVMLRAQVQGRLDSSHVEALDRIAREVGDDEAFGTRVTFIAADGTVLGDSQADADRMASHLDRSEVLAALTHGWGVSTRWSTTLSRNLRYVALRVGELDNPEGVVRLAVAARTIGMRERSTRAMIWTIAAVTVLATIAFALGLARLWTMPIRRITAIANRLSSGDFSSGIRVPGSDELAALARALNDMRDHLREQLGTIDRQRLTLEALLNQLLEGIIVAGPDARILLANPAAAGLLEPGSAPEKTSASWVGRPVEQCVPPYELQRLLLADKPPARTEAEIAAPEGRAKDSTPRDGAAHEVRIELPTGKGPVVLMARATDIVLPASAGRGGEPPAARATLRGRILALRDITQIDRALQMKTDFVANASHELRTPLSAIRAAVETMLHIEPSKDTDSMRRFLGVIDRHSARLEALVADLLALSRLESPSTEFKPETIDLRRFCDALRGRWADAVAKKQLQWSCQPPTAMPRATADVPLLDLVMDNLVDNAVKFTTPGGRVTVAGRTEHGDLIFDVEDNGCGIPPSEQERVFERFYQVAPARSGTGSAASEVRGTGLGLAIVRHAVAAMRGTVSLTSQPGVGTRVTVVVPQPPIPPSDLPDVRPGR